MPVKRAQVYLGVLACVAKHADFTAAGVKARPASIARGSATEMSTRLRIAIMRHLSAGAFPRAQKQNSRTASIPSLCLKIPAMLFASLVLLCGISFVELHFEDLRSDAYPEVGRVERPRSISLLS